MDNIIYFELNNWFSERDFPDDEPFISWFEDDLKISFDEFPSSFAINVVLSVSAAIKNLSFSALIT